LKIYDIDKFGMKFIFIIRWVAC